MLSSPLFGFDKLIEALGGQFEKIGVRLQVDSKATANDYFTGMVSGQYPAAAIGYGLANMGSLYVGFVTPQGPFNPFHVQDPQLDALYAQYFAASEADSPAIQQQINAYLVDQAWTVPVVGAPLSYYTAEGVSTAGRHLGEFRRALADRPAAGQLTTEITEATHAQTRRRRLAWSVPLLLVASVISFVFVALLPGDPARSLLGQNATPQQVAAVRDQLGLDRPLWEQYWNWLRGAVHGDLGSSLITRQPVTSLLNDRLEPSLSLIIGATLVASIVGVTLGIRGARRGPLGRVVDAVSVVGIAIPDFWLGLMLIVVFAVQWSLFPPTGYVPIVDDPAGWPPPWCSRSSPWPSRRPRSSPSRHGTPSRRRSTGPSSARCARPVSGDRSIVYRHALKNAAIPILTVVGLVFIGALSGTVAVESIFAIPGLGSTAVQATSAADLPLIQGVVVYFTLIVIAVNLLVDLAYGYFNPRVRLT